MNENADSIKKRVMDAVLAVEKATGFRVALHRIASPLIPDMGQIYSVVNQVHVNEFCRNTKALDGEKCFNCDAGYLNKQVAKMTMPFARTCHAGADEVIAPMYKSGVLCGILFLGQFKYYPEADNRFPKVNKETLAFLISQTHMLATFLLDIAHVAEISTSSNRIDKIQAFLRKEIAGDPSLSDLGDFLGLSTSRASHLVKEETGFSFRELKENMKLDIARELLSLTNLPVKQVAKRSGFKDADYFSRYFAQKSGCIPSTYRKQNLFNTV